MKKIFVLLGILLTLQTCTFAAGVQTYDNGSKRLLFGLKDGQGNAITKPEYNKIIRLGKTAWIVQKKDRFGIMNDKGDFLTPLKYRHAERFYGSFVKLGNDHDYGLYDETGKTIIPPEYSKIDPLFGRIFLTCKNYKYGITDEHGNVLLGNDFDDIYMPEPTVMRLKSDGEWFQIEKMTANDEIKLPENARKMTINDKDLKVTYLMANTGIMSGYSVVTAADYTLKLFSSISPAYEDTIDDLMFSQGADTVTIFTKMAWIPMFPVTYLKKYFSNLKNPNNGPLSEIKDDIKKQIK